MTDKVVKLNVTPRRWPPHVSLIERIKQDREASKARVQEETNKLCADVWRGDKFSDARTFIDRLMTHPLGGREWVLQALERLRSYVESR